jgi:hypothetical protein
VWCAAPDTTLRSCVSLDDGRHIVRSAAARDISLVSSLSFIFSRILPIDFDGVHSARGGVVFGFDGLSMSGDVFGPGVCLAVVEGCERIQKESQRHSGNAVEVLRSVAVTDVLP